MRERSEEGAAEGNGGGVIFSELTVAKLAGHAARTTYGVVDLRSAPFRRVADLFRGTLTEGVEVSIEGLSVRLRLHVVMERGVNLAQVTAILQEQVRYQIEHATGLTVDEVDVRVEDLRE
jgi:uncharacterized alkaline shock family protein YloU